MSEKRKFNIVACEPKDIGNGRKVYNCVGSDGVKYACWDAKVMDLVQKGEREYNVFSKQVGEYLNWYIDLKEPGQGGGGGFQKRPFTPSFRDSKDGIVLSSRTMVLSYCKDVVVSLVNSAQLKKEDIWPEVKKGYEALIPLLALDSIKEPVQAAPTQPQGHEMGEHKHTLKPVLITILKGKMTKMNFRSADMVDYSGAMCGIELKRDHSNDEIIWDISEEDAHKLITAMG